MATKPKDTTPDEPVVDRKGYVTVTNGDQVAKILPESLRVWVKRGWKPVDPDSVDTVDADPFTNDPIDTTDDADAAKPLKLEG